MFLNLTYIIVAIATLTWSADKFTDGASAIARNFGIKPMIIGLTIVAMGTSAPEIAVSLMATFNGNPDIAIGNALGSNITNISLVLAVTAIIKPIDVDSGVIKREFPALFIIILITGLLSLNRVLSPLDFTLLFITLICFITWLTTLTLSTRKKDPLITDIVKELPKGISNRKAVFYILLGLVLLPLSSKLLVMGASEIARTFGISELVIGLSIVAIGTSLPELAAAVASVLKKENALAVGNIIGSNIFNLLAVYSIPGLVNTPLSSEMLYRDYGIMTLLTIILFFMAYGFNHKPGKISRGEGTALLLFFIGYQVYLYYA